VLSSARQLRLLASVARGNDKQQLYDRCQLLKTLQLLQLLH